MISVIIPVYNCEKFLARCVESVLGQSYMDFELILVNDGSTDSSGTLCEEFKQRDTRVHVIHKENGGASSARNAGLAVAAREYIAFIDADDWVEPEYLKALVEPILKDRELEVVLSSAQDECLQGTLKKNTPAMKMYNYVEQSSAISDLIQNEIRGIWAMWAKLYRKDLLVAHPFRESLRYGEDLIENLEIFLVARKFYYAQGGLYHYFHGNIASVTNRTFDIDCWNRFLMAWLSFMDDSRLMQHKVFTVFCLRSLKFYELLLRLYIFRTDSSHTELETFYQRMGAPLLKIFNTLPATSIYALKKRLLGTYQGCCSMISELLRVGRDGEMLFIYGAGKKAKNISDFFMRKKMLFNSFIVSDGKKIGASPDMKHPVIHFSDFLSGGKTEDTVLFLALKDEYAEEVLLHLNSYKFRNIFCL